MYHLTKKYQKKVRTLNEKLNELEGKRKWKDQHTKQDY
jgi:hypothetical protein